MIYLLQAFFFDDFEKKVDEINENDKEVSLILLELNLKNYVQENNISKNKITEINKYFSIMREHGYKVIFRVVYDSEGTKNPEPEFDMLLKQIEQLKDIYVSNKDIIFVVEAGFLGTNGEWINGKYDKYMTEKNKIIENANDMAREISNGTKAYADNILAGVQVTLEDALKVIENNRKEVK